MATATAQRSGSRPTELDEASYAAAVEVPGIVLVSCWAPWCPTCRAFGPVFEGVASRHPEHTFVKLNAQQEQDLVAALGVEQIPSLLLYRDGLLLLNEPGTYDDEALEDIIHQAESLDMDDVRRTIAAEQATA